MLNKTLKQNPESLSPSEQISATQKQLLIQRYLQNPFSISWSKLTTLLQTEPTV